MIAMVTLLKGDKLRQVLKKLLEYLKKLEAKGSALLKIPQVKELLKMKLKSMDMDILDLVGKSNQDSTKLDDLIELFNKLVQIVESLEFKKQLEESFEIYRDMQRDALSRVIEENNKAIGFIKKLIEQSEKYLKEFIELKLLFLRDKLEKIGNQIKNVKKEVQELTGKVSRARESIREKYPEKRKEFVDSYVRYCEKIEAPGTREEAEELLDECEQEVAIGYPEGRDTDDMKFFGDVMHLAQAKVQELIEQKAETQVEEIQEELQKDDLEPDVREKLNEKLREIEEAKTALENEMEEIQEDLIYDIDREEELEQKLQAKEADLDRLKKEYKEVQNEIEKYENSPLKDIKELMESKDMTPEEAVTAVAAKKEEIESIDVEQDSGVTPQG